MDWDEYFFNLIPQIQIKSKDRTKVGCVIVAPDNSIVSAGFNGFPRKVKDDPIKFPERYERAVKLLLTVHAEKNAIFAAAKRGVALEGCRLYIEWHPCSGCMGAIVQTGIQEVILNARSDSYNDDDLKNRWAEDIKWAKIIAEESNVKIRVWK